MTASTSIGNGGISEPTSVDNRKESNRAIPVDTDTGFNFDLNWGVLIIERLPGYPV